MLVSMTKSMNKYMSKEYAYVSMSMSINTYKYMSIHTNIAVYTN